MHCKISVSRKEADAGYLPNLFAFEKVDNGWLYLGRGATGAPSGYDFQDHLPEVRSVDQLVQLELKEGAQHCMHFRHTESMKIDLVGVIARDWQKISKIKYIGRHTYKDC